MMMSYDSDPKEYARLAGFGYRMLAEAIKADLPYHISCLTNLFTTLPGHSEIADPVGGGTCR